MAIPMRHPSTPHQEPPGPAVRTVYVDGTVQHAHEHAAR